MTDRKDGPDKGPQRPGDNGAKRTHATIELTAKEVSVEDPKTAKQPTGGKPATTAALDTAASAATIQRAGAGLSAAAQGKPATAVAGASPIQTKTSAAGEAVAGKPATVASTGSTSISTGGATTTGKPTDPRAEAAPTPAMGEARRRGGMLSHGMAAIVGGLLVTLGAGHISPWLADLGIPVTAPSKVSDEVVKRLSALEKNQITASTAPPATAVLADKVTLAEVRLAKLEATAEAIAALQASHAKLAAESRALAERTGGAGGGVEAGQRIARLEETLATMAKAAQADPQRAGRLPQLAAITGKLADLEQASSQRATALRKDLLQEVETRIGAATEASETAKSGTTRLDREVAGMRTEAARAGQRLETLKAGSDRLEQTVRVLQEGTAKLDARLKGLDGDVRAELAKRAMPDDIAKAVNPVIAKVTTLERNVAGVVKAEADRQQNAERIVLALELANLKRAMERGTPFSAELGEVKKVAGGRLDLKTLEQHQSKGVATLSALGRELSPLIPRMLDAETEKPDAGVVDRLLSGAKSIVRVRKITHAADDKSVEAGIARIEAAVKDGRLGDALAAAEQLPAAVAKPAATWLSKVEARHAVDRALAGIEAALKASLGAGVPSKGAN